MKNGQIEGLAYEILRFLLDHELWQDVTIYFCGKALSTDDRHGNYAYNDPSRVFVLENLNPKDYFPYVGSILSMSFEGPLYDVLNYGPFDLEAEFSALLAQHGLYYELGNTWNLTLCEI